LFQVIISGRAERAVKKLPGHYKRRVLDLLLAFRENPVPAEFYDIRKLKGYVNIYRARIGDIRVIYEVMWNLRKVHVLLIEWRERAYP